jgi:hypothetical protein
MKSQISLGKRISHPKTNFPNIKGKRNAIKKKWTVEWLKTYPEMRSDPWRKFGRYPKRHLKEKK